MENIAVEKNFTLLKSEVLREKRIVVMCNNEFNIYDIFKILKLIKGINHRTKIKFLTASDYDNSYNKGFQSFRPKF
jgi:hypothetical protein